MTRHIEEQLAADTCADHDRAIQRGLRVRNLVDAVIDALLAEGLAVLERGDARVVLFHVIADDIYGNAAIDIPPLREDSSWRNA